MDVKVEIINAFTYNDQAGNGAGVVLNGHVLSDEQKLYIANAVGLSETAFCDLSGEMPVISFFTPITEVNFCGHATLALFYSMFRNSIVGVGRHVIDTKIGNVYVEINESGYITLDVMCHGFFGSLKVEELAEALQIDSNVIGYDQLAIEVISAGDKDGIVPVKAGLLDKIDPDFEKIKKLCIKNGISGIHLFEVMQDAREMTFNCRNFAPLVGILEESATGSSSASLLYYLDKNLPDPINDKITFFQGRKMGQLSQLVGSVENPKKDPIAKIGGYCSFKCHKVLNIVC